MPWIPVVPENQGGGRKQKTPSAKLYDTGQFVLTHAAVALLGDPPKVRVQINPDERAIRLTPTTPTDSSAFALAGGGNVQHRISLKAVVTKYPQMVGAYRVVRSAGGIE